jgi:preprotein translocase subunit SecA
MQLLGKLLGDPNKRDLKLIQPLIDKINALEPDIKKLSDEELAAKTVDFRSRLSLSLKGGLVLESELVKLFREALEAVEPLSEKCTDAELHVAVTQFRQKLEYHDPERALSNRLKETLTDCFAEAYDKLSPVLDQYRIAAIMNRIEEQQLRPDEAEDPKQALLALLKEIEPALNSGGMKTEMFDEAFDLAWSRFQEQQPTVKFHESEGTKPLELLLSEILQELRKDLSTLKIATMNERTAEMARRYKQGKTLDDLLPEAFAVVREAGWRCIKMRHYDVQLIGGVVLHQGKIAEMRTGEGKTLVATCPVYLNALTGKGVHVVTVNDYLARRDAEWMGQIYTFLGLTVGILVNDVVPQSRERRAAYQADITYGTNNEFGFDYLRDNMVISLDDMVQRKLSYAIVDEVDNILIDEARTPLIISGQGQESTDEYSKFAVWARDLKAEEDYTIDEKTRTVLLTESGIDKIERKAKITNIYDEAHIDMTRYMENAIKAQVIFKRDKDYIVKDDEVIIVDEFTGRQMPGRRYSEGLHQAIEAKEHVKVQRESHTLATITFQNYFRLYAKLAGMTGTAITEAEELSKIYNLDVMVIPTNKPIQRQDLPDLIYRSQDAKFQAVVKEIKAVHKEGKGRPILVGTTSVEISEHLSSLLERDGIPHNVLNAKYHEREAQIISQAGRSGAVTIATNMAGRGTDILLGGNAAGFFDTILRKHAEQVSYIREMPTHTPDECEEKEEAIQDYLDAMAEEQKDRILQDKIRECKEDHDRVVEAGGLHIIGTERHESRRIDNQLRGRAGRQGDRGSSRFFLALDDEIMRRFAADRVAGIMERLGMEEDMPIESKMVSRFIEGAQTRVEGHNFDIRKNVVDYDDVIAKQREVIYADRRIVLERGDMHERILSMMRSEVTRIVNACILATMVTEEEQLETLYKTLEVWVTIPNDLVPENIHAVRREDIRQGLMNLVIEHYERRGTELRKLALVRGMENADPLRDLERECLLRIVDRLWMDHIDALDIMRAGIGFRAVGQRDPLVEFKNEAYRAFEELKIAIQHHTVDSLLRLLRSEENVAQLLRRPEPSRKAPRSLKTNADQVALASGQVKRNVSETQARNSQQARKNGNYRRTPGARNAHNTSDRHSSAAGGKIGRNDPCYCGSGKKFKKCHGA